MVRQESYLVVILRRQVCGQVVNALVIKGRTNTFNLAFHQSFPLISPRPRGLSLVEDQAPHYWGRSV